MIYHNKNSVMIRTSVDSDIERMKAHIRKSDIDEIRATNEWSPEHALRYGLTNSEPCFTIVHQGKPVGMFGVTPAPKEVQDLKAGVVWLIATDGLKAMWLTFCRLSPKFISLMLEKYEVMYNFVDARNIDTIRWLNWCGAKFDEPKPYGIDGLPFRFFKIVKESPLCAAQQ